MCSLNFCCYKAELVFRRVLGSQQNSKQNTKSFYVTPVSTTPHIITCPTREVLHPMTHANKSSPKISSLNPSSSYRCIFHELWQTHNGMHLPFHIKPRISTALNIFYTGHPSFHHRPLQNHWSTQGSFGTLSTRWTTVPRKGREESYFPIPAFPCQSPTWAVLSSPETL